ncbi:hypothetical protein OIO90_003995 [Microbotryomycetes sp. JL221]|nr:hypothetical protein OIO90_003995 [Microbotryomycetes sp. JL221]
MSSSVTAPGNPTISASAGGEFSSALDGSFSSPSRSAGDAALPPIPGQTKDASQSSFGDLSKTSHDAPSSIGLAGSTSALGNKTTSDLNPTATKFTTSSSSSNSSGGTVTGHAIDTVEQTIHQQAPHTGLVAPQAKEDMNEATKHVDNLATGIAGVALTAPLAAIEKVSPVLAEKVQQGVESAKAAVSNATSGSSHTTTGSTATGQQGQGIVAGAAQTAQGALETVKSYLPVSLGGKPADTSATTTPSTTTTSSGPTLTERASNAATSTKDSIASTAQAYLPASIVGSKDTSSTTGNVNSPYVSRDDVKPTSTIDASDVTSKAQTGSNDLLSKGSSSSSSNPGLAPASFYSGDDKTSDVGTGSHAYKAPTEGAPMYTGTQAGTQDYKKDQSDFAPAEYAADKHKDTTATSSLSSGAAGLSGSGSGMRQGAGGDVGPDPETKPAREIMSSGGGLGATAESDLPASSTERGPAPTSDPKSAASALDDPSRATGITTDPTDQITGRA